MPRWTLVASIWPSGTSTARAAKQEDSSTIQTSTILNLERLMCSRIKKTSENASASNFQTRYGPNCYVLYSSKCFCFMVKISQSGSRMVEVENVGHCANSDRNIMDWEFATVPLMLIQAHKEIQNMKSIIMRTEQ